MLRPDFFVVAGETAGGKFYTRYGSGPGGLRGFSIGYDKAVAPQFDRLVVAIANSFTPFPEQRLRQPLLWLQSPNCSLRTSLRHRT